MTHRPPNPLGQTAPFCLETAASLVGGNLRRLATKHALPQNAMRFRSLFEQHNAMMLLVDPARWGLVDANVAAATFYGYSRDRLRSLSLGHLGISLPTAHGAAPMAPGGFGRPFTSTTRLADGTVRWVEVHSSPVAIARCKVMFSILHDVTEQKTLEKQVVEIGELERQRIGRDLHDSLGGHLTGVALLAEALRQLLDRKGLAEAATAAEVLDGISEAIARTRDIAHRSCPVETDERDCANRLRKLASEVCRRTGTDCRFLSGVGIEIKDIAVAAHLFRIAEEAVQNALRHARPNRIEIRLGQVRARLRLRVWNDGEQLPPLATTVPGLGLCSMRYRASMIDARLEIRPAEHGGTEVCCTLPGARRARTN